MSVLSRRCRADIARAGTATLLAVAVCLASCSVPAEEPIVRQFFADSRLRDRTALQKFSTVVFEPRTDGIVRTVHVVGVSPERADGRGISKTVSVDARVALPDGTDRDTVIEITLTRTPGAGGRGDWIVTGFRDRGAPPR